MSGFSVNGIAKVLSRLGDPSSDTLTDINAKLGDIARSLDAILGSRWDSSGDLGSDIASILGAVGAGSSITGTADSGTAGTLVDAALTEGDDHYVGMVVFMTSGDNAGLSRVVVDFDAASDTLYFEPDFPQAIGTDDYIILDQAAWAQILIGNNNADNEADTSAVTANADGSVLEREEYIQGKVDDVLTDTAEIGAAGAGLTEAGGDGDHLTEAGGDGDHLTEAGGTGDHLTDVPWNSAWDAEVQSEVTDALDAYDPPTDTEMDGRFDTVDSDVAAVKTVADNIEDYLDGTSVTPQAYRRETGVAQITEFSITCAANAGQTTVATGGTNPVLVERVVLYADAAQTADLTELTVACGDTGDEVVLLNRVTQADLDDASKQAAWDGAARLAVGDIITIIPTGTGATALDLTLAVVYRSIGDGGVLS
jgi:hypothetical protein